MSRHVIDHTATLGKNCWIGHHVVIHKDVVIDDAVTIGDNVVILEGTRIGARTIIGPNSVLGRQPVGHPQRDHPFPTIAALQLGADLHIGAGVILYAGSAFADGIRIGDQTTVAELVEVGAETVIGRSVAIDSHTKIGQRVMIQTGSFVGGHTTIDHEVNIGPGVVLTNDKYMRAQPFPLCGPHIGLGVRIGANATLLPAVSVGVQAMIGAGAVVTHDVEAGMVVAGCPARKLG